ncbi:MAG: NIPSNAP family protein [Alphaproteobacteria bacterium]|nr:NIPSNAP family protein [Alphaproteobacteria bacterium]
MIVEERIYTLKAGATPDYMRIYETEGLPIQTRILGNLVGWYTTDFGPLNQVVHMWGYADFADRTRRRAALAADKDWQIVLGKLRALILTQENKILSPAPWSPVR